MLEKQHQHDAWKELQNRPHSLCHLHTHATSKVGKRFGCQQHGIRVAQSGAALIVRGKVALLQSPNNVINASTCRNQYQSYCVEVTWYIIQGILVYNTSQSTVTDTICNVYRKKVTYKFNVFSKSEAASHCLNSHSRTSTHIAAQLCMFGKCMAHGKCKCLMPIFCPQN